MKRICTALICAILVACSPLDTAASVGGLPPPGQVSDSVKLDEKAGIAVETMYTATVKAGALAFRSGLIAPSANPVVHAPGFCAKVATNSVLLSDTGARVNALECKLRAARDLTRAAYDAGNGESYDVAAREAIRIAKELLALLGSN